MVSLKTSTFRKSEDCPTSNELLAFQNGDLAGRLGSEISRHLASCEFCAAEAEFYSRFPQDEDAEERIESARIPAPLLQLAEALLRKKHSDPSSLDSLLKENGLVLDKA
jgi:hypothetical protein